MTALSSLYLQRLIFSRVSSNLRLDWSRTKSASTPNGATSNGNCKPRYPSPQRGVCGLITWRLRIEILDGQLYTSKHQPPTKNRESHKMQAVVFNGPLEVTLETRPIPQIQDPTDAIIKVRYTALCGRSGPSSPLERFRHNERDAVNSTSSAATNPQAQAS